MKSVDELKTGLFMFLPQTKEEAAEIQRRLFGHGIVWASGSREVSNLDGCVSGWMELRHGALSYAADKEYLSDHPVISLWDIAVPAVAIAPAPAVSSADPLPLSDTITLKELKTGRFYFTPKTSIAAEDIQRFLLKHGIKWKDGSESIGGTSACAENHILVDGGRFKIQYKQSGEITGARQITLDMIEDSALAAERRMTAQFNALSAKVDQQAALIERQSALIEKLYNALIPRDGASVVQIGTPKKKAQGGTAP